MNGPEHYREAETLLADAARWERNIQDDTDSYASINSARLEAQVHATLALAAAQVEAVASRGPGDLDPSWREALGWESLT